MAALLVNSVLSAAALIVALVKATPPTELTYTTAEKTAAQAQLCTRYQLAALAVRIATNTPNVDAGVARNTLTNGALILDTAAADPAIEPKYRDASRSLAIAYQTQAAMGNTATPDQYQVAMDDTNAKDSVLRNLCGA